jgi:uncharacterized RDD family membrane protein YckC
MADETATPPPASPTGFFSKPPARPATTRSLRPPSPPPPPGPAPVVDDVDERLAATEARPWTRYFARVADVLIGAVGLGVVIGLVAPDLAHVNNAVLGIAVVFAWIFVETVLLATWGTTPGKWMLGVRLRTRQGFKLQPGAALGRSFSVWLRGLGLGIPIVSLFTLFSSYKHLKEQGETSWDAQGGFEVRHDELSAGRVVVLVMVVALFVILSVIGAAA